MGEIAEMMLEGILCEGCGAFIDDNPPGHPRYCSKSCSPIDLQKAPKRPLFTPNARKAARHNRERHQVAKATKPFECDHCHRLFRTEAALMRHDADKHSAPTTQGES